VAFRLLPHLLVWFRGEGFRVVPPLESLSGMGSLLPRISPSQDFPVLTPKLWMTNFSLRIFFCCISFLWNYTDGPFWGPCFLNRTLSLMYQKISLT